MAEDNFDNVNENDIDDDNDMEVEIYTLTDEDGTENDFELIGRIDDAGQSYVALAPVDEDENDDSDEAGFVVLKVIEEDGEEVFVTIEDDEEFDRIADIFEDELMQDLDYDGDDEENGGEE